jgi:hypothetical protein
MEPFVHSGSRAVRGPAFVALALSILAQGTAVGQSKTFPLKSPTGLRLNNVAAEPAVLAGKEGLRLTVSEEYARRFQAMPSGEQTKEQIRSGQYAVIEGLEFANGVIEVELAGAPAQGASSGARGFVGIAFRLHDGAYDAFYLRPTNGRAEDQERRNHSVQYISHPDWPWFRNRKETPEKYESYVDLEPGVWTKLRIEVRGEQARLFVHGQQQPTLIVRDLKTGAQGKGSIGLWIDQGTVAHFRNLSVSASAAP